MQKHDSTSESREFAARTLAEVQRRSDRWLSVVVEVGPTGLMTIHTTTCNFDLGRASEVCEKLHQVLAEQLSASRLDTSPLPPAPEFAVDADAPAVAGTIGNVMGEAAPVVGGANADIH
jgi:hypothetical protein